MAETSQFGLPLLSGGQAQKSVTVNEALCLIDAVAQLRITSSSHLTPPIAVTEGDAFLVPTGSAGDWFGQDGLIAVACNQSWRFVTPKVGWQAFNVETGTNQLFDGHTWLDSTLAATVGGSAIEYVINEVDHVLVAGSTSTIADAIPANSQVIGVTARVIGEITGTSTWELGVPGASTRFGRDLGIALNSYAIGMSDTPTTYYLATPLVLSSSGGDFSGGEVKVAVHYVTLMPPRAV